MKTVPTGTERMRAFVPAQDFDLSKSFYEALGFEKVLDGEVAIFNEKEIVVDYIYFHKSIRDTWSKEWKRFFEVGKVVTMWLRIKNEISIITTAPGIREEGEEPTVFYMLTTKPK